MWNTQRDRSVPAIGMALVLLAAAGCGGPGGGDAGSGVLVTLRWQADPPDSLPDGVSAVTVLPTVVRLSLWVDYPENGDPAVPNIPPLAVDLQPGLSDHRVAVAEGGGRRLIAAGYVHGLVRPAYVGEVESDIPPPGGQVTIVLEPAGDNLPPIAYAGLDLETWAGSDVSLDGSGSFDVNGDPLDFQWTVYRAPLEGDGPLLPVALAGLDRPVVLFRPLESGRYQALLRVGDGREDGGRNRPAAVSIAVRPCDRDEQCPAGRECRSGICLEAAGAPH